MTQIIDSRIEPPATITAPATIETMLAQAVDRGIDPAGLEKLLNLYERVQAKRAEQSFMDALKRFREECPPLEKNREAFDHVKNKHLYDFLDLPGLQKIIDPVLSRNGLTYKWDTDITGDSVLTTCILYHVDGHRESSKFVCNATGTQIMSQPQKAASAATFGRRYSLLGVLGISADNDTDARDLTPPQAPQQHATAPQAQPRNDRVTKDELGSLFAAWKKWAVKVGKDPDDQSQLAVWASAVCQVDESQVMKLPAWTRHNLELGQRDLKAFL